MAGRVQIAGHTFTRPLPAGTGEQAQRVQSTVVIYDVAHSANRFIGGYAPDGVLRVYPPVAQVIAHELAHVISRRAPIQQQFERLIESTGASPFTRYAASNPQTEFFPEAFALYLLDPAWVQANHPQLYDRVQAYARRPRPGAL
jgi:Mlc titration factor MtfA (ptsG expression regulator)